MQGDEQQLVEGVKEILERLVVPLTMGGQYLGYLPGRKVFKNVILGQWADTLSAPAALVRVATDEAVPDTTSGSSTDLTIEVRFIVTPAKPHEEQRAILFLRDFVFQALDTERTTKGVTAHYISEVTKGAILEDEITEGRWQLVSSVQLKASLFNPGS
jgi:hypothetical protein